MDLIQYLCYLAIFSDAAVCKQFPSNSTVAPLNSSTDRLSLARLESIRNSINRRSQLAKMTAADFIFDFDQAVTGVSRGTGGKTVAATVGPLASKFFAARFSL